MNNNKSGFNFKRQIIYPACALFFVIVLAYFLIAISADINVTESETVRTQVFDGESIENKLTSETAEPAALPVQTLLGLFLFSLSVCALSPILSKDGNKIYLRFLHFGGTLLAFFIFVLALSGYISDGRLPIAFASLIAVAVIYFIFLGIIRLFKKLWKKIPENAAKKVAGDYVPIVFAGFTVIVFGISLFALISGLNVIVTVKEDKTFIYDDVLENVFVTVVTPLAPTLQNYLRYLASAFVYAAGYAVLFTKLHKVWKNLINFVIISAGYMLIWIIGFDYFKLVKANSLPAIIVYLAVYLVINVAVYIRLYVKTRKEEAVGDYENQFLVRRK